MRLVVADATESRFSAIRSPGLLSVEEGFGELIRHHAHIRLLEDLRVGPRDLANLKLPGEEPAPT
jgi:hypothetical protein